VSTVAIIPARAGSKGIKDKNIVELNGKPLIYFSLKACFDCPQIDHVVLTTDSEKIAKLSKGLFNDLIIVDRPQNLADDHSTSELALIDCIEQLDGKILNIDKIVFVQATSPLTNPSDLTKLINQLNVFDSAAFFIEDYGFFFDIHNMRSQREPRQKRTPLKREAGNAWAFKKDKFLKNKTRLFGNIGYQYIDPPKHLEVDDLADLLLVEHAMKISKKVD